MLALGMDIAAAAEAWPNYFGYTPIKHIFNWPDPTLYSYNTGFTRDSKYNIFTVICIASIKFYITAVQYMAWLCMGFMVWTVLPLDTLAS